jgi:hypothetical protein
MPRGPLSFLKTITQGARAMRHVESKPISFRLEDGDFRELEKRAKAAGLSPGAYAREALLRELGQDLEMQLDGIRQTLGDVEALLASRRDEIQESLSALNDHLRVALTALLVEMTRASDTTAVNELVADLIPSLPGD